MRIDKPVITIQVAQEGKDKPASLNFDYRLISLHYEDDEKKADKLTLHFDNHDWELLDSDHFKKGNIIIVGWGYPGNMQTSTCVIERLSGHFSGHGAEMSVEALHRGFLLHKNKKSRTFDNMTRSEVVKKIAHEQGYPDAVQIIEDTKVRHDVIGQAAETDAAFIKRLANRVGFQFWIDDSGFHFHQRRLDQVPIKKLRWFTDQVGEIIDGTWETESKKKHGRVQAESRDPMAKQGVKVDAKNSTVKRSGLAEIIDAVESESGADFFQKHLADDDIRPSSEASAPAAKAAAEGAYKQHQISQFVMKVTCVGDPTLKAKRIVELSGIAKKYSGLWYIRKASHKIDQSGYTVSLEMVRDGHNGNKSKGVKSAAAVNKQKPDDGPEINEVVSGPTGETHLEWKKR